jgi:hypothetical protein
VTLALERLKEKVADPECFFVRCFVWEKNKGFPLSHDKPTYTKGSYGFQTQKYRLGWNFSGPPRVCSEGGAFAILSGAFGRHTEP